MARRRPARKPPPRAPKPDAEAPAADAPSTEETPPGSGGGTSAVAGMNEAQIRAAGLAVDVPFETSGEPQRLRYGDLGQEVWEPPDGWEQAMEQNEDLAPSDDVPPDAAKAKQDEPKKPTPGSQETPPE